MEWLLLLIAFFFAFAFYLLFFIDRNIGDKGVSISILIAAMLFGGGYWLLKKIQSVHDILWGLIYISIGFWLVFKFPAYLKEQSAGYSLTGIIVGLILLIYGILLII